MASTSGINSTAGGLSSLSGAGGGSEFEQPLLAQERAQNLTLFQDTVAQNSIKLDKAIIQNSSW